MAYALSGLCAVLAFAVIALVVLHERAAALWRDERAEVLNRIQHPAIYQPTPRQRQDLQDQPPERPASDEFEMAGRIIAGDAFLEENGAGH